MVKNLVANIKNTLSSAPTSKDFYILGFFISFITFSFISTNILYIVFPILIWSLYQDWRSARVAEQRQNWIFNIMDIITVFNYTSIFIALTLPSHTKLAYSERIWIHWGIIFIIYIIWNIIMMRMSDTDEKSRSFFLKVSTIEIPIPIYCFTIYLEAKIGFILKVINFDILVYSSYLLIIMVIIHSIILSYWLFKTYFPNKSQ